MGAWGGRGAPGMLLAGLGSGVGRAQAGPGQPGSLPDASAARQPPAGALMRLHTARHRRPHARAAWPALLACRADAAVSADGAGADAAACSGLQQQRAPPAAPHPLPPPLAVH